jgi:hypothetical protein
MIYHYCFVGFSKAAASLEKCLHVIFEKISKQLENFLGLSSSLDV